MQALFALSTPGEMAWREVATPVLESPTDALVRPLAVAACDLDRVIAFGRSPFPGEFALGHEFTGEILALGEDVKGLAVGDRVLSSFQPSCGMCHFCGAGHSSTCAEVPNGSMFGIGEAGGAHWGGAYAEAVRVPWANFTLRRLPDGVDAVAVASASDNLADGLRCVDGPLTNRPGGSVLITGDGSIPLYAVACAFFLGAGQVTFASRDEFALGVAERLGADCLPIDEWPKRFAYHDITVDGTNDVDGLSAVIKSTTPYGACTSASIYFGKPVPVPMFHMNMKGITFRTGRVNSASALDRVLKLVTDGFDPEAIEPMVLGFDQLTDALKSEPLARKLIATPG